MDIAELHSQALDATRGSSPESAKASGRHQRRARGEMSGRWSTTW